jgi:ADP-ribosylglycohydrolase
MNYRQRLALAKKALKGTSIGDAFGESFFGEMDKMLRHIETKTIPTTTWEFTDDTVMSIAIFEQLEQNQMIIQNDLALAFANNHRLDTNRGYGATARRILRGIEAGENWQTLSKNVFDGMGSMGNGAAMRVHSIGAYFYDDFEKIKIEATKSAEITHANIEAIAGAIAVAIGTAITTKLKIEENKMKPNDFINLIINELPETDTKSKINKALSVPNNYHIESIKTILGNGNKMTAQDTVPFAIWCVAHNLYDFENALWKAVSVLGDRDTIGAIVGGMAMMSSDEDKIPLEWLENVEDFEKSVFRNFDNI